MFRKIVSSLPYNPGLLHQLGFYAKRLHQEEAIRRVGVIFTVLALSVQTLAVLVPAEVSLATSDNDIVYGATSKQQIVNALSSGRDNKGRADIKQIYDHYGITLSDIQASVSTTVKSRERQYITTGRGDSPGVDTPIQIPGTGTTIYERSLNVWDIKKHENSYPAIRGTATGNGILKGRTFWILLKGCGNITFESVPGKPELEIKKKTTGATTHKPGDQATYRIEFRNPGNAPASGVNLTDTLAEGFTFASQTNSLNAPFKAEGRSLTWTIGDLQPTQSWHSIELKVTVGTITTAKAQVCNGARLVSSNAGAAEVKPSDKVTCISVDNACPGTSLPIPQNGIEGCQHTCPDGTKVLYNQVSSCKSPVAVCEYLKVVDRPAWNKLTYEVKYAVSKGGNLLATPFSINGQPVTDLGQVGEPGKTLTYTHTFAQEGSVTATADGTAQAGTDFKAGTSCQSTETLIEPYTRIATEKRVKNITKGIEDANGTTASPGDELEYSLSISNSGNVVADNYIPDSDVLNDVLAYADLQDFRGASFDRTHNRLTWPAMSIAAGSTVTKTFTVKVKDPIPTTPASLSDPHLYDFAMVNTFGNQVTVKIQKPGVSLAYETVTTIPDTGPGASIAVSLLAALAIGYFYARSRLLAKEVEIIKNEQLAGA